MPWIHFSDANLAEAREILKGHPVGDQIEAWLRTQPCAENCDKYREAARKIHNKDGEVEIDDDVVVSVSEDGGAYVSAWVWVYDEGVVASLDAAIRIGRTIGAPQGWQVFECDGSYQVQRDDEMGVVSDDQAIILAKAAGIQCDDDGYLVHEHGQIIGSDDQSS